MSCVEAHMPHRYSQQHSPYLRVQSMTDDQPDLFRSVSPLARVRSPAKSKGTHANSCVLVNGKASRSSTRNSVVIEFILGLSNSSWGYGFAGGMAYPLLATRAFAPTLFRENDPQGDALRSLMRCQYKWGIRQPSS